ncbi:hypothetical protein BC567DRAFT_279997 [Phyllosticta citribraziliensis]
MAPKERNVSKAANPSEKDELVSETSVSSAKEPFTLKTGKTSKRRRIRPQIVGVSGEDLIKKVLKAYYRELRLKAIVSRHGHLTTTNTVREPRFQLPAQLPSFPLLTMAPQAESTEKEPKKWPHVFERSLYGDWLCGDGHRYSRMTVEARADLDQFELNSHRERKQRQFEARYGPGHRL